MNSFGLTFHHLGLAVRDPAMAKTFALGLGYTVSDAVLDPLQNVHLRMCEAPGMPSIEIISPTGTPGPLDPILKDVPAMLYHTCYESSDIAASLDAIRAVGLRAIPVSQGRPAVLFGGAPVSFYNVMGVGLIEIIEREAGSR